MQLRLVALVLITQSVAHAQDVADDQTQKVEVVGSRISRVDTETALPVQIIGRKQIDDSGVQTTEELVGKLTANTNGTPEALSIGNDGSPGKSSASLRGLGPVGTLVLLNGRRLANYAFDGAGIDLHAIPLAAIQRVEILKDGASALYGSDAIAGVINFVTRSDFQSGELTLNGGTTQGGGAARTRETLAFGHGDPQKDGYNLFGVVDHQRAGELAARQRSFSATSYRPQDNVDGTSGNSFPANILLPNSPALNPAAPGCTPFTVYKNGGCYYNPATQIDDLPPSNQTAALGRATVRLGPEVDAFAEALYETDRLLYKLAAMPVFSGVTNGAFEIDVPTTSPFYPRGLGLTQDLFDVHYRTVSLGPRVSESDSVNERGVAGLKGAWAGWDFDSAVSLAESHASYGFVSGYVGTNELASAFATGEIDPFADSGPAGDALLAGAQLKGKFRSAQGITRMVDLHASREVAQLPGGPLALAIGAEWRRETLRDAEAPLAADVAGGTSSFPRSGARNVRAAFVELDGPIVKGLEGQVAARYDHYSDFGNSVTPKASLAWRPNSELLLRASGGRGFRAPTLPELDGARTTSVNDLQQTDPVRCPITHLDSDCDLVIAVGGGSNPALKPMRSTQRGFGAVLQPTREMNVSVDYWNFRIDGNITDIDTSAILADPTGFARYITRGPTDPAFPGLPGPIVQIDQYLENVSRLVTTGYDISGGYRSEPTSAGRFSVGLEGTFITRSSALTFYGVGHSALGAYINGFYIPRWRHELTFGWERGPCTVTLSQSFSSGYTDEVGGNDTSIRRVGSTSLWDGQVAYDVSKMTSLRLGARNLFDRNPPFSRQADYAQPNYNPTTNDPRGRFVYATVTARFQ